MSEQKKNKFGKREKILFFICLTVFLGAAAFGGSYYFFQRNQEKVYEELTQKAREENGSKKAMNQETDSQQDGEKEDPASKEKNSDEKESRKGSSKKKGSSSQQDSDTEEMEDLSDKLNGKDAKAEDLQDVPRDSAEGGEGALPQRADIPVDFAKLKQKNPEIYGWITIPGTQVEYPILRREGDADYYLDHTVEGASGLPGSIYTQSSYNVADFTDMHTVIYGHNMNDGSMFGSLRKFQEESYLKEHQELVIYTPQRIYTYRIFAAVTYDNRHILHTYGSNDKMLLQSFLNTLQESWVSGYIDETQQVTGEDRIVTLSTCNGNSTQRFLVEAVLVDEK